MDAAEPARAPLPPVPSARPSRRTLAQLGAAVIAAGALATSSALMVPASTAIFDRAPQGRDLEAPGDFTGYGAQPESVRWLGDVGATTVWAYRNVSDFVCVVIIERYPDSATGTCVPPGVFVRDGIEAAGGSDPSAVVSVAWGPRGDPAIGTVDATRSATVPAP